MLSVSAYAHSERDGFVPPGGGILESPDALMLIRVAIPPTYQEGADVTAVLTPTAEPLTALDRCDRCGAQAYIRVTLNSGGELLFCAHHGKKYEESLRTIAADIQDETEKLTEAK
jgi:hypothetical protein